MDPLLAPLRTLIPISARAHSPVVDSLPLSLYVHFPWCIQKCPYCDFNSHPAASSLDEVQYCEVLLADLDFELTTAATDHEVQSIFFGGGTPSLFSAHSLGILLEGIMNRLHVSADAEITLEANPGAAEHADFSSYRDIGINRLSLGVQSFHDGMLQSLRRIHNGDEAIDAYRKAREAGFQNINLDLMYGLPRQRPEQAWHDLEQALALEPDHLSMYQLTLEPKTVFHRYPPLLPSEDEISLMQQDLQDRLRLAGYGQYEVSAYAREHRQCRHNLNYWQFGDYIGIGAGAHGKRSRFPHVIERRARKKHPALYMATAGTEQSMAEVRHVRKEDLLFEFFLNALRLRHGFPLSMASARTGYAPGTIAQTLAPLISEGLLAERHGWMACTEWGYQFLDDLLQRLLPEPYRALREPPEAGWTDGSPFRPA